MINLVQFQFDSLCFLPTFSPMAEKRSLDKTSERGEACTANEIAEVGVLAGPSKRTLDL